MKKLLILITISVLTISTGYTQRVSGFLANWTGTASLSNVQFDKLTHVYYSFIIPNSDGSLQNWQSWEWNHFNTYMAQKPVGLKTLISVGGAGGSSGFSNIASNSTARANFVSNIAQFVEDNDLDGVDIDWEAPTSGEAANFAILLQDLKTALNTKEGIMGKELELTMDVFPLQWFSDGINATAINAVDCINMMAYDNNSAQNHSDMQLANDAIDYWVNTKGAPRSKLILGLPFYGHPAYSLSSQIEYNDFTNIAVASQNDSHTQGGTWYYNGQPTIRSKTQLAINEDLKGVMVWELSQDRSDQYSLLSEIYDEMSTYGCNKPDFGSDLVSLCGTGSVTLDPGITAGAGIVFSWERNGVSIGGNTATYSATTAGTYEVTVDDNGCIKSDIIQVTDTFPDIELGTQIPLCAGETITLDAGVSGTGISYAWTQDASPYGGNTQTVDVTVTGTYAVTLTDGSTTCPSKQGSVDVNTSTPNTKNDTICTGETATLEVTSGGGPFSWFAQASGGSLLTTGNTYTTPTLTSNTTYYVQKSGGSTSYLCGRPASDFGTAPFTGYNNFQTPTLQYQMRFDALQEFTLDSVTIWGDWSAGTATFEITIYESDGTTEVGSNTFQYSADGGAGVSFRVPVGITVPVGNDYIVDFVGTDIGIGWEEDGAGMPWASYGVSGVIDFNTSIDPQWGDDNRRWISAYDWRISTGTPCPREPVTAVVESCNPPTISITQPTNGSTGDVSSSFIFEANASDDGTVSTVVYTITLGGVTVATLNGNGANWSSTSWTPGSGGTYNITATATDDDGQQTVSSAISITISDPTGIAEDLRELGIAVYPNPFVGNLVLDTDTENDLAVTVYDLSGSIVERENYNEAGTYTIGEQLLPGVYLLKIIAGESVVTTRVIKQ